MQRTLEFILDQIHFLKGRTGSNNVNNPPPLSAQYFELCYINNNMSGAEPNIPENNPSRVRSRINHRIEKQEETEESHGRRTLGKYILI